MMGLRADFGKTEKHENLLILYVVMGLWADFGWEREARDFPDWSELISLRAGLGSAQENKRIS